MTRKKWMMLGCTVLLTIVVIAAVIIAVMRVRAPEETPVQIESSTDSPPVRQITATDERGVPVTEADDPVPDYPVVPLEVEPVDPEDTLMLVEAEDAAFTGELVVDSNQPGFSGAGYLAGFALRAGDSVEATFDIPAAQHYDITVSVAAASPVTNALLLNGEEIGQFTIEEFDHFVRVTISGVYLPEGPAVLSVGEIDGDFLLDYFEIADYREMYEMEYREVYPLCDKEASEGAKALMKLLGEHYGKRTITGQYCAGESNTEIELIRHLTGKSPAIRFGDLEGYTTNSNADEGDVIAASADWAARGGIVGLMWHWDAPTGVSTVYAEDADFSLLDAMPAVTDSQLPEAQMPMQTIEEDLEEETGEASTQEDDEPGMGAGETQMEALAQSTPAVPEEQYEVDVAMLTDEEIQALVSRGAITSDCAAILRDIDSIAEALQPLADADIPVLWRPLHEAGGDWFWWGSAGPQAYRWLWRVMYVRMTQYHGLHNLIWVWNGQSQDYLVDADMYDIAALDIYLPADKPFGSRYEQYVSLSRMTGGEKLLALSECSTVPDVNLMFRDNCIWSFFGLWYGEYLIDGEGKYSEAYTPADTMIALYNSEAVVTLGDLTGETEEPAAPEEPADPEGETAETIGDSTDAAPEETAAQSESPTES